MYLSSISSEEYATIDETKQLNLCKINQVIYTIRSTIDNDNSQRNEILDALTSSHNSMSSSHNVSQSPIVTSPVYTNTTNKQPQSPPVPAKSKYRASNTQFVGINGDNHTQRKIQ
ncbi:unnamed protein product [Rotaria sordida]|uniref:Uncharacterized protein n=1 Tax=Rotaria sordida TaxID=392033 RepID=A0A819Y2J8_9BILA|nr:unnamed protein product [Rotaria sordida]